MKSWWTKDAHQSRSANLTLFAGVRLAHSTLLTTSGLSINYIYKVKSSQVAFIVTSVSRTNVTTRINTINIHDSIQYNQ